VAFSQVDPSNLQGEALSRWYLRSPDGSSKNDKPPRHRNTRRSLVGPSRRTRHLPPIKAPAQPLETVRLGRRTAPRVGGVGISRHSDRPRLPNRDNFSWPPRPSLPQRLESQTAPRAMGEFYRRYHCPSRFFRLAHSFGIRPRHLPAAALSLIEEIRRNASSNWNQTPRSAGACHVVTTSRSVVEPPLNGTPIAAGPMARSAFLVWRQREVVVPEFSVSSDGIGPLRTSIR
jgi:hypothetical protein